MELEPMHVLGEAAKFSVKGTNAIAINIAAYIISPPPLSNTDSWHSCALLRFQRVSFFFSLSLLFETVIYPCTLRGIR